MGNLAKNRLQGIRRILLTVAFFIFFGLAIFSAAQIILDLRDYIASENEYEKLRAMWEPPDMAENVVVPAPPVVEDPLPQPQETEVEEEPPAEPIAAAPPSPPRDPAEVNPQYIGWLKISGTPINYPVAQGADNDKYLHTSFEGRRSGLGAIFMDYRCTGDFSGYHSIVYGHNAKNGTMFGSLSRYQNADYMKKNQEITVTRPDGEKEVWHIFAARKSDITDPSFRLNFSSPESFAEFAAGLGAPQGVTRILTLSTCTSGGSNDERMLVHAAIVE